jgi:hypothetical protein
MISFTHATISDSAMKDVLKETIDGMRLSYESQKTIDEINLYDHSKNNSLLLICQNCFWFATNLSAVLKEQHNKCPQCESTSIDKVPICPNESYRIYLDNKTGISLDFNIR